MSDPSLARPRGFAPRFEGRLQRAGGWGVLAIGAGAAIAGAVAAVVIPSMTMSSLPELSALPRLSGTIVDVSGATPGDMAGKETMRHVKARLQLKPATGTPVWIALDTGYFVSRDLWRRCGLGDHNIDSVRGLSVEAAHDGALQVVELRIGRVLCVKGESALRESAVSVELRRRGMVYVPFLLIGGGVMAGMASLMLGLWDKR